jgi:hypothetical protein
LFLKSSILISFGVKISVIAKPMAFRIFQELIFVVVSKAYFLRKFIKSYSFLLSIKMNDKNKVSIERKIIDTLRNPTSARQLKYLGLDLIANELNQALLINLARRYGLEHKLGYLVDISASAAKKARISSYTGLTKLSESLKRRELTWEYLENTLPEYAKRIMADAPQSKYNEKWRIYSSLNPEELHDWIQLYGVKKDAKVVSRSRSY